MEAEAAAALTPAGGPGTRKSGVSHGVEGALNGRPGDNPSPVTVWWPSPSLSAQLFEDQCQGSQCSLFIHRVLTP